MSSYYGLPLLKPPVWTWEVPAYLFVGGAAGAASVLGLAAQIAGIDARLVRDARWIAAAGSTISTGLLISDLGRPARFLYMLRVFKPQSPMSVGAWTLAGFGGASAAAAVSGSVDSRALQKIGDVSALGAAATGLLMSTYTGVLLGATAIPVWKEHVRMLPVYFGSSSLASAAALLELRGHSQAALNMLGLATTLFTTVAGSAVSSQTSLSSLPIRAGRTGRLARAGSALAGPVSLAFRIFGKRKVAAAATLAGALLTRFAWVEAGKESAKDVVSAQSSCVVSTQF